MRTKNVHTFLQRLLAYMEQGHDLLHTNCIYFVTWLDLLSCCQLCLKIYITIGFCLSDKLCDTFTFRLACIQECTVILREFLHCCFICFPVGKPCVLSFHYI